MALPRFDDTQFDRIVAENPSLAAQLNARAALVKVKLAPLAPADAAGEAAAKAAVDALVTAVNDRAAEKAALQTAMDHLGLDNADANVNALFAANQYARLVAENNDLQELFELRAAQVTAVLAATPDTDHIDLHILDLTADDANKANLAAAMHALGLKNDASVDGPTNRVFGINQFNRLHAAASDKLKAQLTACKEAVIARLAQAADINDVDARNNAVLNATTEDSAKAAMVNLGLNPAAFATLFDADALRRNRDDEPARIQAEHQYDTPEKQRRINYIRDHYSRYIERLKHFLVQTNEACKSTPDMDVIQKIADATYDLKIQLLKYKKALEDMLGNPAVAADDTQSTRIQKRIDELNEFLSVSVPNKTVIEQIEENIAKIKASPVPAERLYFKTEYTAEEAHAVDDYAAATSAVSAYLGTPTLQPQGNAFIGQGPTTFTSSMDSDTRWIPMDIITKPAVSTTPAEVTRTATIQTKTAKSAKSDFYFSDLNQFKNVKSIGSLFTKIPGLPILDWASNNIKSFVAIMPNPDKPIHISTATLPSDCTKALVLYCKFKGYEFDAPAEFKDAVEQKHVDLFAAEWKKFHPDDMGIAEERDLEANTRYRV